MLHLRVIDQVGCRSASHTVAQSPSTTTGSEMSYHRQIVVGEVLGHDLQPRRWGGKSRPLLRRAVTALAAGTLGDLYGMRRTLVWGLLCAIVSVCWAPRRRRGGGGDTVRLD